MPTTLKQFLERLITEKAPGPSPSFSVIHALLALTIIAEKSIGRNKLAEELDIGEGATRTLVGRLKDAGLIITPKVGCSLTDKGLKLWNEYQSVIKTVEIPKNELTFDGFNFAVLVKKRAHRVRSGMEQRDAAVMAGSRGATTVLFSKGRLTFPSTNSDLARDFPKASRQINRLLTPDEGDAIIIVSSDNSRKAKYAALAAAWTLFEDA